MRIGVVVDGTWAFFNEICDELARHHEVTVFQKRSVRSPFLHGRINARLLRHDMQRLLNSNDLVFFEWASDSLAYASHLNHSCKIVTRLHRYELFEKASEINWQAIDQVITVSHVKRDELLQLWPQGEGKVAVIPSAVNLDRFHYAPRQFEMRIGTLSHLFPRKRIYELVLAFYELMQRGYGGATLHIVGGRQRYYEDYEVALHEVVTKLNLRDKVFFYGHVEQPEAWYQSIDVYVSNAYSEGLTVSLLEAMACGCYPLSHFWSGAEEVLPGAQLFSTNEDFLNKLILYAELPDERKVSLQCAMRAIVCERFNLDRTKIQVRTLLEQVIGGA